MPSFSGIRQGLRTVWHGGSCPAVRRCAGAHGRARPAVPHPGKRPCRRENRVLDENDSRPHFSLHKPLQVLEKVGVCLGNALGPGDADAGDLQPHHGEAPGQSRRNRRFVHRPSSTGRIGGSHCRNRGCPARRLILPPNPGPHRSNRGLGFGWQRIRKSKFSLAKISTQW